jgi:methyl-galactoside transport system substrate-binding protein
MKKFLALALAVVMMFSLAACGGNEAGKEEGGADKVQVEVFWYDESDVYLSSVRNELNTKLDAMEGISYNNQFAANTQSTQIDQIKTAVGGGADVIIVNQVTSGSTDVAKDIVAAAGDIPVIFFNRAIGTDGSDVTVLSDNASACFIGTDAPEAGHMQGKMIGEYVVANFDALDLNGDGSISYAMFMGQLGNAEAIARTQYGVEDANAVLVEAGKP